MNSSCKKSTRVLGDQKLSYPKQRTRWGSPTPKVAYSMLQPETTNTNPWSLVLDSKKWITIKSLTDTPNESSRVSQTKNRRKLRHFKYSTLTRSFSEELKDLVWEQSNWTPIKTLSTIFGICDVSARSIVNERKYK